MTQDISQELSLLLNGHIPKDVKEQLLEAGVDVEYCEEVGLAEAPDEELWKYVNETRRTLVTADKSILQHNEEGFARYGMFQVKSENQDNIGLMVTELKFWAEAIREGAATLEDDIYFRIQYI